jgi:general secretion pathway protein D
MVANQTYTGAVPPSHTGKGVRGLGLTMLALLVGVGLAEAQDSSAVRPVNDSVVIRLVDTDLRAAIQALGRYLPRAVLTVNVPQVRVTLEPPGPVPRSAVEPLLRGLVEAYNLQMIVDSAYYRIEPRPQVVVQEGGQADGRTGGQDVQLFVIRLKHARASDVAATVNLLFGGSGEFSGRPGLSNGTLSDELRRQNVTPDGAAQGPSARPSDRSSALSGAVTIVPDELTNSLLIRASKSDYDVMVQAVDQLDIRPLQVLIEVLIVEFRSDRSFSLGNSIHVPPQSFADGSAGGDLSSGGIGDVIIRLMNLGKADIDATIRIAATRGDAQIVSRPVLLASNNTEASFLVGSQRPFVQVSRSLPTDTPTRDQVVQYRDVGTKLTVLPTINQDGYVSLLIQQEINQATAELQFDAPVISTREARTQVLVRDGQTIVIGGLRDRQEDRSRSGIPLLSALPLIGGLFGTSSSRKNETELYIFITPRIIASDDDASRETEQRMPEEGRIQ